MPDAVIVDAVRTPIGRAAKGSLKDMRADDLAAVPLAALVERNLEVDFAQTDDILMGCGFPMGEQGYNVGRNAQLLAGIDYHVPAVTVSRFCSSSLQALRMAFHAVEAGEGDQYVAAGESGHFNREIVPVTLADGTEVIRDDGPRPGTTVEVLAQLKPAFNPE